MFYSNSSYAPVMITDGSKRGQGHPLKSFSVPAPPLASSSPTSLISDQGKTGMLFNTFVHNIFVYSYLML